MREEPHIDVMVRCLQTFGHTVYTENVLDNKNTIFVLMSNAYVKPAQ